MKCNVYIGRSRHPALFMPSNIDSFPLSFLKSMRRRYVSLVCTPGLAEAHLLLFESEAKWAASNPPSASPSCTPPPPGPPSSQPTPSEHYSDGASTTTTTTSVLTTEQLLLADDGSRKGAKYVVRLEGLFYVGVSRSA